MNVLQDQHQLEVLKRESLVLIVQIGSSTCNPCIAIKQRIDLYLKNKSDVNAIYIPLESYRELIASYKIFSVPTVLVFVEGKLTIQKSGYFSLDEILSNIDRYLELLK